MHECTYNYLVDVEWDPRKAAANRRKHGVDFADASTALHDEWALTLGEAHPGEERFVTLAMDALGRVLVVVYTWRSERVRLISARLATRGEQRQYTEQK
jgi:hypothetical protein